MKLIAGIFALLILALIFIYFAPADLKEKTVNSITNLNFIPEGVKDKVEEFLLSPPQKRSKLIQELEEQLKTLATIIEEPAKQGGEAINAALGNPLDIIKKAEELINKLKQINNAISPPSEQGCDKKP